MIGDTVPLTFHLSGEKTLEVKNIEIIQGGNKLISR